MAALFLLIVSCPFLLVAGVSFDDASRTVRLKISQGELLGKRIDAYDNRTGYGFLGIPFGAPPVGPLRFAKPVAAPAWDGVRNVTVKGDACPADGLLTYKRPEGGPMSEDCLHAYVYASKNCLVNGGCPIMWILHGGRFNFESPVVFIDDAIVHNFASDGQDVVVIIPAYRLENFGFLNISPGMNTSAVPNTGMWDLLLAMQWTHNEAHHFGGDPMKITIFGHSAGSMFGDIISTSPHFDGLFKGLVLMSGADTTYEAGIKTNSLASWVTAKILGCATDATNQTNIIAMEKVIACMRAKTWQEIVEANMALNAHPEDYHGPHADGPGGILPLPPSTLARNRRPVPTMIGVTSAEFHETKFALKADGTADLNKVAELCELNGYAKGYTRPDVMTKLCLDYYMQGKNVQNLEQDTMFFVPTFTTVRDMAKTGNKVYLYSFTYKGVGDAFRKYMTLDKDDHPAHSEDYVYILGMHRGNFSARDYEIEKIYSGMVLAFVNTGNPNLGAGQPVWKPFSKMGREYYEIDFDVNNRMPGMRRGFEAGAVKLWVDDAKKYAGPLAHPVEYPSHADRFYPMDMYIAYGSHHLNMSIAHDKTLETEEASYKLWTDYVNYMRLKHLQGINKFRNIAVESTMNEVVAPTRNNIMVILVICVSSVLIFLLHRCCLHYARLRKEKKEYEEF